MCSPGINGEVRIKGQPSNPGSPAKMAVKTESINQSIGLLRNGSQVAK